MSDRDHQEELEKTGFWGKMGVGAIILAKDTKRLLVGYRSKHVEQPHTYGMFGGAVDPGEDLQTSLIREIEEETGYNKKLEFVKLYVFKHQSGFEYHNYLAIVPNQFKPKLNWENDGAVWCDSIDDFPHPLHFGLIDLIKHSKKIILDQVNKLLSVEVSKGQLSPILFHTTSQYALASIAKNNRFELKPAEGTEWEKSLSKKTYYMSFARTPISAYIYNNTGSNSAILEIDGRALNQNYSGSAIDYWSSMYENEKGRSKRFESEDRLMTNKSTIPKASKYIKAVHMVWNEEGKHLPTDTLTYFENFVEIFKYCKIHKIPQFFYKDGKELTSLSKTKRTTKTYEQVKELRNKFVNDKSKEVQRESREWTDRRAMLNSVSKSSRLYAWYVLWMMPIPKEYTNKQYDYLSDVIAKNPKFNGVYKSLLDRRNALRYHSDRKLSLDAEMHNAKSAQFDSMDRKYLNKLITIFRKNGLNVASFLQKMEDKWL